MEEISVRGGNKNHSERRAEGKEFRAQGRTEAKRSPEASVKQINKYGDYSQSLTGLGIKRKSPSHGTEADRQTDSKSQVLRAMWGEGIYVLLPAMREMAVGTNRTGGSGL